MLIDSKSYQSAQTITADVCILGGGVAGIVLANELRHHFSNVVLLEAGSENYQQEVQDLYTPAKEPEIYPNPLYSRLRFLGGASNHWSNNTSPLSAIDFEQRDWVQDSGWPIAYQELASYYETAAQYCQTGNDGYDNQYWLAKLGVPKRLSDGNFSELGIAKAAIPPTRFYAVHGNKIAEDNKVTVIKHANVVDLEFDPVNSEVQGVQFNCYNRLVHTVRANKFIMCFGGIENARMLLHFNQKHNNRLGNKYDVVGRYFMDHPTVNAAHLYSDSKEFDKLSMTEQQRFITAFYQLKQETLREYETNNLRLPLSPTSEYGLSDGISSYHILADAIESGTWPDQFGTHIANFVSDIDMVMEAVSRKQFDRALFDSANQFAGYQVPLMMEQTPDRNNRVQLGRKRDKFGIARIEINWQLMPNDIDLLWRSLKLFGRDMGALSLGRLKMLKERSSRMFSDQIGFGHHHMGTTRMAETADKGVVDPNLRVFGTNNLFVSGCSVFPTGGHVPPTMTIVALSIRLANHLKNEARSC